MRWLLVLLLGAVGAVIANLQPAAAQSAYSYPICLEYGIGGGARAITPTISNADTTRVHGPAPFVFPTPSIEGMDTARRALPPIRVIDAADHQAALGRAPRGLR